MLAAMLAMGVVAVLLIPSLLAHPQPQDQHTRAKTQHNDGPALRRALVPVAGAELSWRDVLGWPSDERADPCSPPLWRGISCTAAGRVEAIDFRQLSSRAELQYTLCGPALLQLISLRELHLQNTLLRGTLPSEFISLQSMEIVRVSTTPLSGTLPANMSMPKLSYFDAHETLLQGTIPDFSGCTRLEFLDLSSCGFRSPPSSLPLSLDHLYLNSNPLNTTTTALSRLFDPIDLHNLEVSFLNAPVALVYPPKAHYRLGENGSGTRVIRPQQCRIDQDNCTFRLDLYDEDNCRVHVGGLLSGLTLRYKRSTMENRSTHSRGQEFSAPFVDMRNGSFAAIINSSWVQQQGPQLFHFYHGAREFLPRMTEDNEAVSDSVTLRTIQFLPKICTDHTLPNSSTGARCDRCRPGFVPDAYTKGSELACIRQCNGIDQSTVDGADCECVGDDYDTNATGIVVCMTAGWSHPYEDDDYKAAQQQRTTGGKCAPCPKHCATCSGGVLSLRQGWRLNASSSNDAAQLVRSGTNGKLQVAFRCPFDSACPHLELGVGQTSLPGGCLTNHSGFLCATCKRGYSLQPSEGSCLSCDDNSHSKDRFFGLSALAFTVLIVLTIILISCWLWHLKAYQRMLLVCKGEVETLAKIVLGQLQVLVLLRNVLNLVFPPQQQQAMSVAALFTLDLRRMLPAFDCLGWSWYAKWSLLTLGLPAVGFVCILARFLWHLRTDRVHAFVQASKWAFLLITVLYPQVSQRLFMALRCRQLGQDLAVLEADYTITCTGNAHYQHVHALALVLVVLWPFGIPGLIAWELRRQWRASEVLWNRRHSETSASPQQERSSALESEPRQVTVATTLHEFHYKRIQATFDFCTRDYRAEVFWFEPVDMVRKLGLTGLLQLVRRGSGEQVMVGCVLSFMAFGLTMKLQPYREPEANVLKALVDFQIFVSFLCAFILRVLAAVPTFESLGAHFYGDLLVASFVVVLIAAVVLFAHQVRRNRRHLQHSLRRSLSGVNSPLGRALRSSLVGTDTGAELFSQARDPCDEPPGSQRRSA
eukprot:COSAG02_NODE_1866_length_10601_cov_9.335841_5_plen_1042_part_00